VDFQYADLDGNSSIVGFDEDIDSISVYFSDGSAYVYCEAVVGRSCLEYMKELAEAGRGLNSYIMHYVRFSYSRRFSW
jgi:hypothetical protein